MTMWIATCLPATRWRGTLDGYAALHRATGLTHAVLFWLESPGPEASLRTRLAVHPAVTSGALAVATSAGGTTQHPAGPVWAPLGRPAPSG